MPETQLTVPVLTIAFNRPDVTNQSFQKIREARPLKLYVAVDGSRTDIKGEDLLVEQVRNIVQQVDWPCDVKYMFNQTNQGAEITISSALSWVFAEEEYAIILEDDIIASKAFFRFAEELLIRYKDNQQIGTISASNFTPMNRPGEPDYFFAKYAHSGGGWATWKRTWETFDLNTEIDANHLSMKFLRTISNSREEALYYRKKFMAMKKRGAGNNTWDSVGNYINRIHRRINIVPRVNLSSNIGIYGLHAKGETEFHFLPYDEDFTIKKHPERIEPDTEYDIHHFKNYINKNRKPLYIKGLRKLKKIFTSIFV
jgi:hypothetical protein